MNHFESNWTPSPKIWSPIYDTGHHPDMWLRIYAHAGNFDNNGDKYLVGIRAESQHIFTPKVFEEELDNPDYNLSMARENEAHWFVICGNWEIDMLAKQFSAFIKPDES